MGTMILVSIASVFFIVYPRMAGMRNVITKTTQTNIICMSVIGTMISLPLVIAMVLIFG